MIGGDGDGTWLRSSLGRSSEGKHLVHTIFGQPKLRLRLSSGAELSLLAPELSLLVFECEVLSPPLVAARWLHKSTW